MCSGRNGRTVFASSGGMAAVSASIRKPSRSRAFAGRAYRPPGYVWTILGYSGSYTALTDFLRDVRPPSEQGFEVRFETPPGEQAQVDFAQFHVVFTDEPTTPRIVWLFSMVLGYSRLIWARFVMHQNLPTVLRCHVAAFEAIGAFRARSCTIG